MMKLIMVDQALGYSLDSFAVREEAAPLLKEKVNQLMNSFGIAFDKSLPMIVQEWLKLADGDQKNKKWQEIKETIEKLFN